MLAIPAFRAAAAALSESLRVPPGAPARLVSEDDLALPAVESMLHQRHSIVRQVYGWTPYLKGPDVAAIVEREYALGSVDP